MERQHYLTVLMVVCLLVAGCAGSGPGDSDADDDADDDQQASGGAYCSEGDSFEWANPQTGEQVSMDVEGIVTYEGREVCKAVWDVEQSANDVGKIEYYYNEDQSYVKYVVYDTDGNVMNEAEVSGGSGSSTGGGSQASTGGTGSSGEWCEEGYSISSNNAQTGEDASFEIKGIVTHEGRQVCKAVWEQDDSNSNVVKTEYYFNEESTYQKYIRYDENGNVVNEFELTPRS